jgi:hypothetical protein
MQRLYKITQISVYDPSEVNYVKSRCNTSGRREIVF